VANQASLVGKTPLAESLVALGRVVIQKNRLFSPEHRFRGLGEDAVPIEDDVDRKTGIPIISLMAESISLGQRTWRTFTCCSISRIQFIRGPARDTCGLWLDHRGVNPFDHLPVPQSPNLPTMNAILLYPSLCFFTSSPLEVFGHPELKEGDYSFTPESMPGADSHPKLEGNLCHGMDLRCLPDSAERQPGINPS
jgi:hypothetical protein